MYEAAHLSDPSMTTLSCRKAPESEIAEMFVKIIVLQLSLVAKSITLVQLNELGYEPMR